MSRGRRKGRFMICLQKRVQNCRRHFAEVRSPPNAPRRVPVYIVNERIRRRTRSIFLVTGVGTQIHSSTFSGCGIEIKTSTCTRRVLLLLHDVGYLNPDMAWSTRLSARAGASLAEVAMTGRIMRLCTAKWRRLLTYTYRLDLASRVQQTPKVYIYATLKCRNPSLPPPASKNRPYPHRLYDLQDTQEKRCIPKPSDFVPIKNGLNT